MENERRFKCSSCHEWELINNIELFNDLSVCPRCKTFLDDKCLNYHKKIKHPMEEYQEKIEKETKVNNVKTPVKKRREKRVKLSNKKGNKNV